MAESTPGESTGGRPEQRPSADVAEATAAAWSQWPSHETNGRAVNTSLRQATTTAVSPDGRLPGQRAGGWAAILQAVTFIVGFAIYGTVIADADYGSLAIDPATHVAFLVDNQLVLHAWYAVIYLVFGGALVVLAPALHDRVRSSAPTMARVGTIFGLIWATLMFAVGMTAIVGGDIVATLAATDGDSAVAAWSTTRLVMEGMGGGIEIVGGLWIGLVSVAALRSRTLPVWLNRIGVLTGIAGIATTSLVAAEVITSVFGLGSIVWFTWLGIHLVRGAHAENTSAT